MEATMLNDKQYLNLLRESTFNQSPQLLNELELLNEFNLEKLYTKVKSFKFKSSEALDVFKKFKSIPEHKKYLSIAKKLMNVDTIKEGEVLMTKLGFVAGSVAAVYALLISKHLLQASKVGAVVISGNYILIAGIILFILSKSVPMIINLFSNSKIGKHLSKEIKRLRRTDAGRTINSILNTSAVIGLLSFTYYLFKEITKPNWFDNVAVAPLTDLMGRTSVVSAAIVILASIAKLVYYLINIKKPEETKKE